MKSMRLNVKGYAFEARAGSPGTLRIELLIPPLVQPDMSVLYSSKLYMIDVDPETLIPKTEAPVGPRAEADPGVNPYEVKAERKFEK